MPDEDEVRGPTVLPVPATSTARRREIELSDEDVEQAAIFPMGFTNFMAVPASRRTAVNARAGERVIE